jgi:hypothetical protein
MLNNLVQHVIGLMVRYALLIIYNHMYRQCYSVVECSNGSLIIYTFDPFLYFLNMLSFANYRYGDTEQGRVYKKIIALTNFFCFLLLNWTNLSSRGFSDLLSFPMGSTDPSSTLKPKAKGASACHVSHDQN